MAAGDFKYDANLPYPIWGAAYVIARQVVDSDGTPMAGLTTIGKVCLDQGSWATSTNAPTELTTAGLGGLYNLRLDAAETKCSQLSLTILESSGPSLVSNQFCTLNPRRLPKIYSGTVAAVASPGGYSAVTDTTGYSEITLDSGALAVDNAYVGAIIRITGGTGVGQARVILGYSSGRVATVFPWETTPDVDDTYELLLTESTTATIVVDAEAADIAAAVWNHGDRELTDFSFLTDSSIATEVWATTDRTLTDFFYDVTDIANAVWVSDVRSLSEFTFISNDSIATAVWNVDDRTITNITLDFILTETDISNITSSVWDALQSDHIMIGTFGSYLDAKISGILPGSGSTTTTPSGTTVENGEIRVVYNGRGTLYAIVQKTNGDVWDVTTGTFVTFNDANMANYAIYLRASGGDLYVGDYPDGITIGLLTTVTVYLQNAGPVISDGVLDTNDYTPG